MTPERAVAEIAASMPATGIVVDESLTAYTAVSRYFRFEPGRWFRLRGGGIGAGMPMPIGIQLADPDRRVSSPSSATARRCTRSLRCGPPPTTGCRSLGDPQQHELPRPQGERSDATASSRGRRSPRRRRPRRPELDFVSLARGFGVEAHRVEHPDHIRSPFWRAISADHPVLIDVSISGALTKR